MVRRADDAAKVEAALLHTSRCKGFIDDRVDIGGQLKRRGSTKKEKDYLDFCLAAFSKPHQPSAGHPIRVSLNQLSSSGSGIGRNSLGFLTSYPAR